MPQPAGCAGVCVWEEKSHRPGSEPARQSARDAWAIAAWPADRAAGRNAAGAARRRCPCAFPARHARPRPGPADRL